MRIIALAVIGLTAAIATPSLGEDSYFQPSNRLNGYPSTQSFASAPNYDQCFRLGWVRGVHVERGEWDDFYEQCIAGEVPFDTGSPVDSVKLDHGKRSPHS